MPQSRDRPVKTLLLMHNLDIGGAQVAVLNLAQGLKAVGWPFLLCTWRRSGVLEPRFRAAGIPLELPESEVGGWRRLGVLGRLRRVVAEHDIEVVHTHMSDSALWGMLLQRFTDVPFLATHHSNDLVDTIFLDRPRQRRMREGLLNVCARQAAFNVAVAPSVQQRVMEATGLPAARVPVIANGIPMPDRMAMDTVAEARRARAATPQAGGPTLVFVGRLHEVKGQDTLVAAMPRVLERLPQARLILVGDGEQRTRLEATARDLAVADHVIFAGHSDDIPAWLAQADIFVSASRMEGHPLAILEAMSWKVPVVMSDIPGHRNLMDAERIGVICPPSAPEALAEAVAATVAGAEARERRVEHAYATVAREYSATTMAQHHIALYREVAGR